MTGRLAPLFAQVREGLDVLYHYTSDLANPPGEGRSHSRAEALAALSAIERHVQDMDALVLDMGEELDRVQRGWTESMTGHFRRKALLARLSGLGAGDSNQNEKEPGDE